MPTLQLKISPPVPDAVQSALARELTELSGRASWASARR